MRQKGKSEVGRWDIEQLEYTLVTHRKSIENDKIKIFMYGVQTYSSKCTERDGLYMYFFFFGRSCYISLASFEAFGGVWIYVYLLFVIISS